MATPATPVSSGFLTVNSAADHLEKMLSGQPEEAPKPEAVEEPPAETEPTEPAAEGASEEQGESEETEEAPQEQTPEQPTLYTVKIDGKEQQVTLEEMQRGYQREADYTRKTQAVAEDRKALQAALEKVRNDEAFYAQALPRLQQLLQAGEQEPNWTELEKSNPTEYLIQRDKWRTRQESLEKLQAEQMRLNAQEQAKQAETLKEVLREQGAKLLSKIPEWKDEKVAVAEKNSMIEFAQGLGYSREELDQTYDHRAVVVLRKAMLYDQLSKKTATLKPTPPAVRPAKPGSAPAVAPNELENAKKRLLQTGSVDDAARVIEKLLA